MVQGHGTQEEARAALVEGWAAARVQSPGQSQVILAYTRADVDDLRAWARRQATDCLVLTTQKDLVKLRLTQLGGHDLCAVAIRLHVEAGQDALDRSLLTAVGRTPAS